MIRTKVTIYMNSKERYAFTRETSSAAETYMCIFEAAEAMDMPTSMRTAIQENALEGVSKIYNGNGCGWAQAFFKVEKIGEAEA